ncbi:hypothetical protein HGRIS_001980 [Hohenbuehelia grisea]|uniref:SAP domain-containing protein n=1 Tax=Hohenbuehelia grisea TaxID=104357 RepID=A0ABR3JKU9_9AGAR
MDATNLAQLKRAQLQKLARENGIKANLKSSTIIGLLIQKQNAPESPSSTASKKRRSASPTPPSSKKRKLSPTVEPASATPPPDVPPSVKFQVPSATSDEEDAPEQPSNIPYELLHYDEVSAYGFTDLSRSPSPLGTPPPPEPLPELSDYQSVVAQMQKVLADDEELIAKIKHLRGLAHIFRVQAILLRNKIRGEKGSRTRAEAFLRNWSRAYWTGDGVSPAGEDKMTMGSTWPYESIWSGGMRILRTENKIYEREITTSDEEDNTLEDIQAEGLIQLKPLGEGEDEDEGEDESGGRDATPTDALQTEGQEIFADGDGTSGRSSSDRSTSYSGSSDWGSSGELEDDDFDVESGPHSAEEGTAGPPPAGPADASEAVEEAVENSRKVDKGKRKMTPEEVEAYYHELHQERQFAYWADYWTSLGREDIVIAYLLQVRRDRQQQRDVIPRPRGEIVAPPAVKQSSVENAARVRVSPPKDLEQPSVEQAGPATGHRKRPHSSMRPPAQLPQKSADLESDDEEEVEPRAKRTRHQ